MSKKQETTEIDNLSSDDHGSGGEKDRSDKLSNAAYQYISSILGESPNLFASRALSTLDPREIVRFAVRCMLRIRGIAERDMQWPALEKPWRATIREEFNRVLLLAGSAFEAEAEAFLKPLAKEAKAVFSAIGGRNTERMTELDFRIQGVTVQGAFCLYYHCRLLKTGVISQPAEWVMVRTLEVVEEAVPIERDRRYLEAMTRAIAADLGDPGKYLQGPIMDSLWPDDVPDELRTSIGFKLAYQARMNKPNRVPNEPLRPESHHRPQPPEIELKAETLPPRPADLLLLFKRLNQDDPDGATGVAIEVVREATPKGSPAKAEQFKFDCIHAIDKERPPNTERTLGSSEAARRISTRLGRTISHVQLLRYFNDGLIGARDEADKKPKFSELECDTFVLPNRKRGPKPRESHHAS